jgi:uncharacterized phiE125 gp8 family phage protein
VIKKLISGPAVEPISLAEARLHLRLDTTGSPAAHPDDTLVTALITAARQHVEAVTARALITQTWEQQHSDFPVGDRIGLEVGPTLSVTSVKYYDIAGALQTLDTSVYRVLSPVGDHALPATVELVDGQQWPAVATRSDAMQIRFSAGYGASSSAVPAPLRSAMLLLIGAWYENREAVIVGQAPSELPLAVRSLLAPFYVY